MTAVGWLVEMICRDVDMYDEEDNEKVEYWNAFQSCTDLSEYINKAKEMEKEQMKMAQMYYSSDVVGFKTLLENQFEGWYNQTFKLE